MTTINQFTIAQRAYQDRLPEKGTKAPIAERMPPSGFAAEVEQQAKRSTTITQHADGTVSIEEAFSVDASSDRRSRKQASEPLEQELPRPVTQEEKRPGRLVDIFA